MSDLTKSMHIAASGMRAQGMRLRVIAENVANADSVAGSANETPYRRKVVSFGNELDRELGIKKVTIDEVSKAKGEFKRVHSPGHPAADQNGYILKPNVNTMIEMTDMREAQRSYEANLQSIQASKNMLQRALDILK